MLLCPIDLYMKSFTEKPTVEFINLFVVKIWSNPERRKVASVAQTLQWANSYSSWRPGLGGSVSLMSTSGKKLVPFYCHQPKKQMSAAKIHACKKKKVGGTEIDILIDIWKKEN